MSKLVVLLRVKDGIFFVDEWLQCFEKLVDEIVVLDNGSTDGTYEKLRAHPMVTAMERTEGYNEGRDKNILYELARTRNPDWCLWLDIDELFEPQLTRRHLDRLMNRKHVNKYVFRRFHFIDRQDFAGSWYWLNYSSGHDRMLWRENKSGYFQNRVLDSPNVKGIKGLKIRTDYRLKHLGYINKELVDKKADIYRAVVPENEAMYQTMYLHNEKRIRWIDNRNSPKVIMLNRLLDVIRLSHLFPKLYRKIKGVIQRKTASVPAAPVSAVSVQKAEA